MSTVHLVLKRSCAIGLLGLVIGANLTHGMTRGIPSDPYAHQLVYVQSNLSKDRHVDDIRAIVERAVKHGYDGVVLSGSFDRIGLRDEEYFRRLQAVKMICDANDMDLIPSMFSVGYGGGILANDRMLVAGLPVRNVRFTVKNGTALLDHNPSVRITNGGFETHDKDDVPGFQLQDKPGKVTNIDTRMVKHGSASLRFDNFRSNDGKSRLMQKVDVDPFRCYRLSFWVKTEDLDKPDRIQVAVMTPEKRVLMAWHPKIKSSQEWTQASLAFNSVSYDNVDIWLGIWGGGSGRFWVDNLELDEISFINVIHRPGAPFVVKNAETGLVYNEGEDYKSLKEKVLSYKLDHKEPVLEINSKGRIRDGEHLIVDYYQALGLKHGGNQTSVCMSEPKTYEILSQIVRKIHDLIQPDYYLLAMDEIRQGGWCAACVNRGLSAAEILGDCVTKQVEIVRDVNPDAQVFIWSDMFDPNHNARVDFALFNGDLTGAWNYIPKDLIVACWRDKICEKSLQHFDKLGFRALGCGYYDKRNLKNAKRWIKALDETEHASGIMYTTWKHDYDFLEKFGDLVQERDPGK